MRIACALFMYLHIIYTLFTPEEGSGRKRKQEKRRNEKGKKMGKGKEKNVYLGKEKRKRQTGKKK